MACGLGAGQEQLKPIQTSIYGYDFCAGFEVDTFNGYPPVHFFCCSGCPWNKPFRVPARTLRHRVLFPHSDRMLKTYHRLKPHQIPCLASIKSLPCSTPPCPISCGRAEWVGWHVGCRQAWAWACALCTGGHGGGHVSRQAYVHACDAVVQT
ncbi:hypothetical protein BC827DRAFT_1190497 [Russula dissimulans]|nr:hypothetical protein BC827DRAFT_1190497 [Russula dissimulans]